MNNKFHAQAEVFVETVRQGSMTAAAAALRMSKSNVSQKIAEMEGDLDRILLKRNTRSIALTPVGKQVFEACVEAIDALQNARNTVGFQLSDPSPQGVVNISGSNLYLSKFILPILPELKRAFPKIRIDLTGGDQPLNQRAEAVDLRIRVGNVSTEGARKYKLPPMERILCAHPSLLSPDQNLQDPNCLANLPIILREQENPNWEFLDAKGPVTYQVSDPAMRVNNYELCVAAVQAGFGAAILTKAVVGPDIDAGNIVTLLPDWKISPIPVALIVPLSRLRRPEVKAATQFITDWFGQNTKA